MNNLSPPQDPSESVKTLPQMKRARLVAAGLSLLAAGAALYCALSWLNTPARPQKEPRPRLSKVVEVTPVHYSEASPLVQVHGEVMAVTDIAMYPQIEGKVVSILSDLAPGMLVRKGDVLATIDEAPFVLAVREAEAELADAKASYQQELGDQAVATRELKLLQQQLKTELSNQQRQLILRVPQLAQAQATIDTAQAALDEARLNLSYTRIRAPFSGIISSKYVDIGSYINTSMEIVNLVRTDAFWIRVSLPTDYISHLSFANESPGGGSEVKVHAGNQAEKFRTGEVYRLLPELDTATRQAQILLRVNDPFAIKEENKGKPSLFVNDYVAVDIEGNALKNVVVLDANLVRNGNQVWVEQQGILHIQPLRVIWREQDRLIASSGLQEGDRLITTNIANVYEGLPITIAGENSGVSTEASTQL